MANRKGGKRTAKTSTAGASMTRRPHPTAYLDQLLGTLPPGATVRQVTTGNAGRFLSIEMRPGAAAEAMLDAARGQWLATPSAPVL